MMNSGNDHINDSRNETPQQPQDVSQQGNKHAHHVRFAAGTGGSPTLQHQKSQPDPSGHSHSSSDKQYKKMNSSPLIILHPDDLKKKKKTSGSNKVIKIVTRYMKLAFIVVIILIIGSVFANVWQAFKGDCADLNAQLSQLEETKNALQNITAELQKANEELGEEIADYEENNKNLKAEINNLTVINVNLETKVNDLKKISSQLDKVFNNQELTYQEFENQTNSIIDSLNEQITALNVEIADVQVQVENASDKVVALTGNVNQSVLTFKGTMVANNDDLYANREQLGLFLRNFIKTLKGSALEGVNQTQVDNFLERFRNIACENAATKPSVDQLKTKYNLVFPTQSEINDIDFRVIVQSILNDSRTICPELFVTTDVTVS